MTSDDVTRTAPAVIAVWLTGARADSAVAAWQRRHGHVDALGDAAVGAHDDTNGLRAGRWSELSIALAIHGDTRLVDLVHRDGGDLTKRIAEHAVATGAWTAAHTRLCSRYGAVTGDSSTQTREANQLLAVAALDGRVHCDDGDPPARLWGLTASRMTIADLAQHYPQALAAHTVWTPARIRELADWYSLPDVAVSTSVARDLAERYRAFIDDATWAALTWAGWGRRALSKCRTATERLAVCDHAAASSERFELLIDRIAGAGIDGPDVIDHLWARLPVPAMRRGPLGRCVVIDTLTRRNTGDVVDVASALYDSFAGSCAELEHTAITILAAA